MTLPGHIASLHEGERRALLVELLEARARGAAEYPASPSQRALWLWEKMAPAAAAYNVAFSLRLSGPLDRVALERAIDELVRRHDALRTTFVERDGALLQRVAPAVPFVLPVVELTGADRAGQVERLEAETAGRPMKLEGGPLFRALLVRRGADDHRLLLVAHHAVVDGTSAGVLFREMGALYGAFAAGDASPLPPVALQPGEVARRAAAEPSPSGDAHARLVGAPAVLELPADRPRPSVRSFRGARQHFAVPTELYDAVCSLARREATTPFLVLLSSFIALLHRYTGETDLVVGSPTANRGSTELEGVVGFLAGTLVMRTGLPDDPTFCALAARVRESLLAALPHAGAPLAAVAERLAGPRAPSHTPVFQVAFAMAEAAGEGVRFPGLEAEVVELDNGGSKFDLAFVILRGRGGVHGWIEYATDLCDADRMERMAGHYLTLLAGAVRAPQTRISALPLLAAPERETILARWAVSGDEAAPPTCIHHLFREAARRQPEAVALVFGKRRVSYGELDAASSRLARLLQRRGVGPDVRVALCAHRSPEFVAALLGILKAGGAYVPLDPAYPAERLRHLVEDARVPVLVTEARLANSLPAHGVEVVLLDGDEVAREPAEDPEVAVGPDHLAYIIYTSGSTGRPKGTEVPHRAIPGFFQGVRYARFGAGEVLFQHSSTSWDALTLELWPALASGGRCVLHAAATAEPADFAAAIRDEGASTFWITAGLFNAIIDTAPESLRGARQLLVGGEAVSAAHVRRALEFLPGTAVVNGYGPSECTVFTACHPVRGLAADAAAIPIGRPVGDRRVYLLDPHGEPVPAGIAGELHVGGPAVPRGYLGRPALTAESFVPDPFSGEPGARLYRSGDLARWRPDGSLEFVGRTDDQVKIRGFRIETGEVEAALARLPEVREAAVVVREDAPGEKQLVAYVVAADGRPARPAALLESLRATLPEYLVPAAAVVLDALPLTAHGKLDRRALPAPRPEREEHFDAPAAGMESLVAHVWADALGVERVGAGESFFLLGGNSLGALRVAAKLGDLLGFPVPLRTLFEAATLRELAHALEGRADPVRIEELAALLSMVDGLSEAELDAALACEPTPEER